MTEDSSTLTTNWQDLIGFTDVSSSGTNGTFRWETCYGYTGSNYIGIHWHDNSTNALVNGSVRHNTSRSEWCHCCVVFDAENGKIYSYSNGELIATHTHLKGHFNANGQFYLGETNNIEGRIQDVRFYDHALSKKEVKEISKGLCLHYQLKGFGGENLLKNGNFAAAWSNWGSPTLREIATIDGKKWAHIKGASGGVFQGYSQNITPIILNSKYTLSFTGYCTNGSSANNINIGFHQRGDGNNDPQIWRSYTLTSVPKRYSFTFTSTSTKGKNQFGLMMGAIDTAEIYFTDVKLECGSAATPWIPNSSDTLYSTLGYNNNIEYDCSGYSNNGTKSGTITCDSDTPRYTTSYKMISSNVGTSTSNGMATIYSNDGLTTPSAMTIAFWLKPIKWNYQNSGLLSTTMGSYPTDYTVSAINQYDSVFRFNASDGSSLNISATSLVNDFLWHHYSFVFDGINVKVYKDGALTNLGKSFSSTKTLGSFKRIFIGLS